MALQLRENTNVANAMAALRQCAEEARGLANGPVPGAIRVYVNNYLNWVEATEAQLRNVFVGNSDVLAHLRSAGHWEIPRTPEHFAPRLIRSEADEQAAWLDELVGRLDRLAKWWSDAPGAIAVVDTNVLLHFQQPSEVDWAEVIGHQEVRLVLPLRVIEELDKTKWLAKEDLADRARRLLSGLWRLLGATGGGPVLLRNDVTIEVPIEDEPRSRTLDADQEILDTCEQVRNVGQPAWLVTGDTGLSLRGVRRGLKVIPMPERYLRKRPAGGSPEAGEGTAGI